MAQAPDVRSTAANVWPALPFAEWRDTYETLHRWLQVAGKVRLVLSPWVNHSWSATLYVTARGLTTSPIPYEGRMFQVDFDFIAHRLAVNTSDGGTRDIPLEPQSVAAFYGRFMSLLAELGISVEIDTTPSEVVDITPFDRDETHRSYDPESANRFWRVLVQADRVLKEFRRSFIGKCSPVHLFWGAPDLAVTRFSGRRAPEHPGGFPGLPDWVTREAYSHEVSSCGFWAGGGNVDFPTFYSYAYPEPAGFSEARVQPAAAFYHPELKEFLLPYDAVRESADPDATLLAFVESTYVAAAELGGWDRAALERERDPREGHGSS
jgi:hypothetical protein